MYPASTIAHFIVDITRKINELATTNLRLNKLLYFAQAWSLKERGVPLFPEGLEAWRNGPVVPSVYREFKEFRNARLELDDEFDYSLIDADTASFLMDVLNKYSGVATSRLVYITHADDGPWHRAYHSTDKTIPINSILGYYAEAPRLKTFSDYVRDMPEIGRHDQDGHLVLPEGWGDASDS